MDSHKSKYGTYLKNRRTTALLVTEGLELLSSCSSNHYHFLSTNISNNTIIMKPWTAALLSFSQLLFVGAHLVIGEDDGGENSSSNKEIIDARTSHQHHQMRRTHQQHLQRQRERPLRSFHDDDTVKAGDGEVVNNNEWPTYSPTSPCEGADPENCGCPQLNQADYRGTISKTETGRTCQYWADQTPHTHYWDPVLWSESGLDANYCRNPDS